MRIPALLKFVLTVAVAYAFFKIPGALFGKPIPRSLILLYMAFTVATILLVMTSTEEAARGLTGPLKAALRDPSKRFLRNIILIVFPLISAYVTYLMVNPAVEAPVELRAVHPAPPAWFSAWGKTYNLSTLVNPLRELEKKDPGRFNDLVRDGGALYFKNCFYCHGGKLDGHGHYAHAFDPPPLPFQGQDTIAQLAESYVFWRIAKGGAGLPKEGAPWSSSMPAWEKTLSEDDVWKVILFIYDYTGTRPRSWEDSSSKRGQL